MSIFRQTLFILLLVPVHIILGDGLDTSKSTEFLRVKKESLSGQQLPTKEPSSSETERNLRNLKKLRKPNFNAPDLRISKRKCYEYICQMMNNFTNTVKCSKYKDFNIISPFVIGGRPTESGEFPHVGAVGWNTINGIWTFLCASTLISSKFMLTAAHCSKVPSNYPNIANTTPEVVRLGNKNILDEFSNDYPTLDAKIQRIIVNPKYASPKKYYDIAIIELQDDVSFNKFVHPACLWTNSDTSSLGTTATLTGWGTTEVGISQTSPKLQAAELYILSSDICDDLLKPSYNRLWCGITEDQLCAGKLSGGVDGCQGDSGGPLQVKINLTSANQNNIYYVLGVTSFGFGCGRMNSPGVYTRVSSFIDWIEDVVWHGLE